MTAVVPERTGVASTSGEQRPVLDVRMGWHVYLTGTWRLVLAAFPAADERSTVLVLAATVGCDPQDVEVRGTTVLPTRTPEEQIRWIESLHRAQAAGRPDRVVGPVELRRRDDETEALVREVMGGAR